MLRRAAAIRTISIRFPPLRGPRRALVFNPVPPPFRPRSWITLACLSLGVAQSCAAVPAARGPAEPLFAEYCLDCHGKDAKKARLRLDQLPLKFADPQNLAAWIKVLDKLQAGE